MLEQARKPEASNYKPVCKFSRCAIVFHFVLVPDPLKSKHNTKSPDFDSKLDSIERDLLACAYRDCDNRPFHSTVIDVKEPFKYVDVVFPKNVTYSAEGHTLAHGNRNKRACEVAAFQTTFHHSTISVLSVALSPDMANGGTFDEIDLISLTKLWEGGEGVGLNDKFSLHSLIRFSPTSSDKRLSISELANKLYDLSLVERGNNTPEDRNSPEITLAGGTIQIIDPETIDAGGGIVSWDWKAFDHNVIVGIHDKNRYIQMALKGMATGLLDIGGEHDTTDGDELVDTQELKDSLRLLKNMFDEKDSKEYAVANKATLLVFNKKCRLYDQFNKDVGANPYLWLPHILAIYNEAVLRLAIRAFKRAEGNVSEIKVEEQVKIMRDCLHTDPLPNVFHYEHEKHLYNLCAGTRGLGVSRDTATARLTRLEGKLSELRTGREKRFTLAMQVIGAIIVVLTIISGYERIRLFPQNEQKTYLGLAFGLFVIAFIIIFFSKLSLENFIPKRLEKIIPTWLKKLIPKNSIRDWVQPLVYAFFMIAVVFFAIWFLSKEGEVLSDKLSDVTATSSEINDD